VTDPWGQPGSPGQQGPPPGYGPPAYGPPGYGPAGYGPPVPGYRGAGGWGAVPATSGRATTVMVLGIASLVTFFLLCGVGIIPAIIALVLARGADREIAASAGALLGAGQVRAGRIMSWVTVGLTALAVLIIVGVIIAIAAADSESYRGAFDFAVHAG